MQTIIHVHADAPLKPAPGDACNGCGVCCLAEPCPVGMLVSRRRHGACAALLWDAEAGRYTCGMLVAPARFIGIGGRWTQRLMRRLIASGIGCDSDLEVARNDAPPDARASR
jgi:hypothetical protein